MCLKLPVSDTLLILVMLVHVVVHLVRSIMIHHGACAMGVSVLMARVGVTGVIVCRGAKG
jgi:hypothetical protein